MADNSVQPNAESVEKQVDLIISRFRNSLVLAKKEFADEIVRLFREEDQQKIQDILEKIKSFK